MTSKNLEGAIGRFLSDMLKNHINNKLHTETTINWMLGASAIIFGLTFPYFLETDSFGVLIISFSSLISFLLSLYSFEPIMKIYKEHNKKDLMYYKTFKNMSYEEYFQQLRKINSLDKLIEQYAIDIKNIANRQLIPKNRSLKFAVRTLLFGVIMGVLIIILEYFLL